jgi:hypothetical protein
VFKALELVEAEQHGEILHLSSWIHPRNRCFREMLHFLPNLSEVDWDDVNDPVPDKVCKGFPEVGERLKASFSETSPAEIEYIVIISDIAEVSCDVHQNEEYLGVPVRGYVATSRRVTRKEWEDSILLCSTELEHLTWTKISGGICCWEQFTSDRDAVNNPSPTRGTW